MSEDTAEVITTEQTGNPEPGANESANKRGELVHLEKEVIVDKPEVGVVKARDKRSGLVDRKRLVRQILCYVCCGEFGTTSLNIHIKTCLKKHIWGLDLVEHEEGIPKKQAALNRKKCSEPTEVPTLHVPTTKSSMAEFDAYNAESLRIFTTHAHICLWCRERNLEAIENAHAASSAAELKEQIAHSNEEEDRAAAELLLAEQHRQEEEEALRRALEEEEAHRLAEEEERAHRLAEDEARRLHDEKMASLQAARLKLEEDRRKAAAEEAERLAKIQADAEEAEAKLIRELQEEEEARRAAADEETRRRKKIALGQHKYLKKHDGALASSQAGAVFQDLQQEKKAMEDMRVLSLAHARKQNLIQERHQVGGETFHESHTITAVEFTEVEVNPDDEILDQEQPSSEQPK